MVVKALPERTNGTSPANSASVLLKQIESEPALTHARLVLLKVLADRSGLFLSLTDSNRLSVVNPVDGRSYSLPMTLFSEYSEGGVDWNEVDGVLASLDLQCYSKDAFVMGERIYKGNTSSIYHCQLGDKECAAKVFMVDELAPEKVASCMRELYLMSEICSPPDVQGIVKYLGYSVRGVHPRRVVILMDLADEPLTAVVSAFANRGLLLSSDVACLRTIFIDILQGLSYLHSSYVIHRDLKCANILVTSSASDAVVGSQLHAELADFGLAKKLSPYKEWANKPAGSTRWMAPEVTESGRATWRSDIWSFGMTLLEALTGQLPYHGVVVLDVPKTISLRILPSFKWIPAESELDVLQTLQETVLSCLQFDPLQRPTADELLRRLLQCD